jgi:molecular chaperone HscB
LAKSRDVHPDLAGESPAVLEQSAKLNEAYATLKDPFRRAEYLLTILGGPSASEMKQSSPEFLEEMLEIRMAIEEAKAEPAARAKMEKDLITRRKSMLGEIAKRLDADKPELIAIRQQLNALRFVNGLIRDLRE